ncbi:MAG TPA: tRNA lysidine(34) synthetase TilS [Candidatus Eisenbacteria bacterium]|nr:tRNA lysidine(34) synthetase TilS [Candidatus Eisenbacteria bacterium]
MNELVIQVDRNIRSRELPRKGERIVVAVSGGLDSMVLLHILDELSREHDWELIVAHLNHQLRGRSSDADERLVQRAAKQLGLEVIVERERVREFARENGLSLEMAGRKLRHDFLAKAAKRKRARCVALGHHADDQVELFFLRLLRGSGGEGLSGMKWVSRSPSDQKVRLIRPLLDVSKEELRAYARENRIAFREDRTNASLDIQRNRIRHELLPLLRKKYQPAVTRTVLRMMETVGAEAELASDIATKWLIERKRQETKRRTNAGDSFEELPVAVQRRCLQLELREKGIEAEFDLIERLRQRANTKMPVAPGSGAMKINTAVPLLVTRNSAGLIDVAAAKKIEFDDVSHELELGRRGQARFGSHRFFWQVKNGKLRVMPKRSRGREVFDADKVGSRITLRHWQPGDRFQPIGMPSSVKLQDIFTNERVPRARRHQLIVAAARNGEIFWVEGLRISERFKLTKGTIRRLQWRWQGL